MEDERELESEQDGFEDVLADTDLPPVDDYRLSTQVPGVVSGEA